MPTDCPDYYTLADGREFVDFFHQECTPLLTPHFDATEIHCIQSAMEHLYRMGVKSEDEKHDSDAHHFWVRKAKGFYVDRTRKCQFGPQAKTAREEAAEDFKSRFKPVFAIVALERSTRWPSSLCVYFSA